jgi:hypothetical protein
MTSRSPIERPLPNSLEAEHDVLGAILLDVAGTAEALRRLNPGHFFNPSHATIFRRMKEQAEDGKCVDLVSLNDSLRAHGELEKIPNGSAFVGALVDGIPRICRILRWVEIIEQKALLRKHVTTADTICELALSANGNAPEVLQEIAILSSHLREEVAQKRILTFLQGPELAKLTTEKVDWIVRPFLAKGSITELGAKVKMGKTTWMLHFVRAVLDGSDFMGEPTSKTPVIYLTEQPPVSFRQAMEHANLTDRTDFLVLLHSEVRGMKWPDIAGEAIAKCKSVGAGVLIVDTLSQFAGLVGDSENNSGDALAAMQPLQHAAADGIAVGLSRHERKSGGDVGDSGRGSSAFAGAVDIILSLRRPQGHSRKTVRVLQALSRFSDTPPELLIELTPQGYVSLGEPNDAALKDTRDSILATAPKTEAEAATQKELMEAAQAPSRRTVQRAVEELHRERMLGRIGKGKKGDPFRYFLSEIRLCATSYIGEQKETILDPPGWAGGEGESK